MNGTKFKFIVLPEQLKNKVAALTEGEDRKFQFVCLFLNSKCFRLQGDDALESA